MIKVLITNSIQVFVYNVFLFIYLFIFACFSDSNGKLRCDISAILILNETRTILHYKYWLTLRPMCASPVVMK